MEEDQAVTPIETAAMLLDEIATECAVGRGSLARLSAAESLSIALREHERKLRELVIMWRDRKWPSDTPFKDCADELAAVLEGRPN
jgi:hypothetical protein